MSSTAPTRTSSKTLIIIAIAFAIGALVAWAAGANGYSIGAVPAALIAAGAAFAVQWVAFIPSWLLRSERFYDLVGGSTYLVISLALLLGNADRGPAAGCDRARRVPGSSGRGRARRRAAAGHDRGVR